MFAENGLSSGVSKAPIRRSSNLAPAKGQLPSPALALAHRAVSLPLSLSQVMPVLIPSGFRPGPARTSVRIPVGEMGSVASWRASEGASSALFMPSKEGDLSLNASGALGSVGYDPELGKEVDERLEDLDSLRQGLLSAQEKDGNTEAGPNDGERESISVGAER